MNLRRRSGAVGTGVIGSKRSVDKLANGPSAVHNVQGLRWRRFKGLMDRGRVGIPLSDSQMITLLRFDHADENILIALHRNYVAREDQTTLFNVCALECARQIGLLVWRHQLAQSPHPTNATVGWYPFLIRKIRCDRSFDPLALARQRGPLKHHRSEADFPSEYFIVSADHNTHFQYREFPPERPGWSCYELSARRETNSKGSIRSIVDIAFSAAGIVSGRIPANRNRAGIELRVSQESRAPILIHEIDEVYATNDCNVSQTKNNALVCHPEREDKR